MSDSKIPLGNLFEMYDEVVAERNRLKAELESYKQLADKDIVRITELRVERDRWRLLCEQMEKAVCKVCGDACPQGHPLKVISMPAARELEKASGKIGRPANAVEEKIKEVIGHANFNFERGVLEGWLRELVRLAQKSS